jgi:hypothetical protein
MVVVIGQVAGSSVAFASGGFLLMAAGPSIEAWRDAMERMAWPFVPLILLAMAFNYPQRSGDGQDRDDTKPAPLRAIWRTVIDHRAIIAILIVGMTMVNVADGAALVWTAPLLARSYGVAAGAIGALLAGILLFSGLVGPVIGGVTADICHRHGGARRSFQMLGVFATLSVAAAFYPIAPGVTSASVLLCVLLTLGIAMGTMVTAVSVVLLPEHVRALCLSLQVAFGAIFGLGIAPLMVSGIGVVSGGALAVGPALGIVCAGTAMIGVTVFLIGQEAMGR